MALQDITQKLLEKYESKQIDRKNAKVSDNPEQHWSYIQAAAVLHCFAPDKLNPLQSDFRHQNPRLLLFDDIVPAVGERAEMMFTLKLDVRRKALKKLATRQAVRKALAANPERPRTELQKTWEDYLLLGTVPEPENLGYQQLTILCQIAGWLNGIDEKFPDEAYLLDLVRRRSVLANFEHLIISNFTGRTKELVLLRDYMSLIEQKNVDKGKRELIKAQFGKWKKELRKPILSIHGPGGIGKSALIGRMLSEQMQGIPELSIPFAYLAFDQPTLRVETPFTLLVEAAAQFEMQFPEHTEYIQTFRDKIRNFRDARSDLGDRKTVKSSRTERIDEVHKLDKELYRNFAGLLKKIGTRSFKKQKIKIPVLLVLDTFEEVQYRDRESLLGLWRMLQVIQKSYSLFRVVVSGRVPLSELGIKQEICREEALSELAMEDRVLLLERMGAPDSETARMIAKQIGGNPLSLRLAANLIASEPDGISSKGIKDLSGKWVSFKIDEELIQGQLYKRILNHIHNAEVRKLAHPGMVLRRVDPDVILHVLAPLCKIPISSLEDAENLFSELKREHALVQPGESGVLIYRPEIRRGVIRLLQQDKFGEVRKLHRKAIAFYGTQAGATARAEEMYHRLVLNEDEEWVLDSRWTQEIESSIAASVEDYPDSAKAWLASRIKLEVPRSVFESAGVAQWERNIFRKIQYALSELQTEWALALFRERSERTQTSPLFALEAKTHLLENDLQQAQSVLESGIRQVSASNNRGRLAELFWLQSQVELLRNDPESADRSLEKAEKAVKNADNPITLTHILCHRLLIQERFPKTDKSGKVSGNYADTSLQLRLRLNRVCERLDENNIYSAQFVVNLAVTLLAGEFPKTSERLESFTSNFFKVSDYNLTSENLQGLEEYREPWENEDDLSPSLETLA